MIHDHGPHDCVPIGDLERVASAAKGLNCSLPDAARYLALVRNVSRLAVDGSVDWDEIGKTIEMGVCAAYRGGEPWARGVLVGCYSRDLGEHWSNDLLDAIVTASEVEGDPMTAARAAAGLLDLPV